MDKDLLLRPDLLFYGKLAQYGLGYCAGQIELTSYCEQRCIACQSWREHVSGKTKGALSFNNIKFIINQLNDMPTFNHLSMTGGEPVLWKDPENPEMDFENLLLILKLQGLNFSLQVNTALVKPINAKLWRDVLSRVRVSLDGITKEIYKKMRGVEQDPEEIIERMEELAHPGLSIMVCVAPENINEVPAIIERLNKMRNLPRKIMCLAVLGTEIKPEFWEQYAKLKNMSSPNIPTSFMEDVAIVREFCNSPEAEKIPCVAGKISFHIKCDGTLRMCCLAGGEAISTQEFTNIGNILTESLTEIQKRHTSQCYYKKGGICSEVCQFKQLYINRIAYEAQKVILTMP